MRLTLFLLALPLAAQTGTGLPWETEGPHEVVRFDLDWTDAARDDRPIPVRIHLPGDTGACPVIVISHGLGGSREGLSYLGEQLASHGYLAVHLQHKGSDEQVWRGERRPLQALKRAAADPRNAVDRPLDVRFALDELERRNADAESRLYGRVDMSRAGIAGHSFGAYTALASCGRSPLARWNQRDERLRACLALSAPARPLEQERGYYEGYETPTFHMTGTEDDSAVGDTTAEQRRNCFDALETAEQYLIIFDGGDHMVFSGPLGEAPGLRGRDRDGARDEEIHHAILTTSTAFFAAWLLDEEEPRRWLAEECEGWLGALGSFERKSPR